MPFESLSERFQAAFKKLRGKGKLSEEDVSEALKEMRRALLEADVNFAVTKDFIKKVKEKAVGEEVFGSLNASQTVIKIVRDELTELLGGTQSRITISPKPPTIIMLVGLQGAGKTTTAAKLAKKLKSQARASSWSQPTSTVRRLSRSCRSSARNWTCLSTPKRAARTCRHCSARYSLCDQPFTRCRHHRYGRPFTYQ